MPTTTMVVVFLHVVLKSFFQGPTCEPFHRAFAHLGEGELEQTLFYGPKLTRDTCKMRGHVKSDN